MCHLVIQPVVGGQGTLSALLGFEFLQHSNILHWKQYNWLENALDFVWLIWVVIRLAEIQRVG